MKIPDNFLYYLSLHEDCNERLLARAEDLTAGDVEVSQHPEVARIKKMVYAVMGEVHRMKAFVRLSSSWHLCPLRLFQAQAQNRRAYLRSLRPQERRDNSSAGKRQ